MLAARRIRPATAADAIALAPLVRASGPRAFDWVFKRASMPDATPFLIACLGHRKALLGWANHHVVELDGDVVASIALWTGAQALGHDAFMAPRILGFYGVRSGGVVARSLRAEAMLQRPKRHELYLGHLAVAPSLRGRGIGKLLLGFAREQAEQRGLARVLLDVADDNHEARRLYESVGYTITGPRRDFGGRPRDAVQNHFPMALLLGPDPQRT